MREELDKKLLKKLEGTNYNLYTKATKQRSSKSDSVYNLPLERMAESLSVSTDMELLYPIEISIIGCGGTGGYLVRDLARFLYSIEKRMPGKTNISITLYDGDIVEEKNILRQNFLPPDIGQNKAEVLANRHTRAFGVNIQFVPSMFTYSEHGARMRGETQKIIIGCVDNNKGRREIAETMKYLIESRSMYDKSACWIDSGNERMTGQVILGNLEMPDVTDLFPEILDPASDSTEVRSCADRLLEDEQNMFVNLTAANLILNYVRKAILDEKIISNGSVFTIDNSMKNYYLVHGDL